MISNNIAKNKKWLPELNTPLPKNPIKLYKSRNKWTHSIMEYK